VLIHDEQIVHPSSAVIDVFLPPRYDEPEIQLPDNLHQAEVIFINDTRQSIRSFGVILGIRYSSILSEGWFGC
jgi:hypothetical protein